MATTKLTPAMTDAELEAGAYKAIPHPGQKVHLQRNGTRSRCRYSARPSRRLKMLPRDEFAKLPPGMRCIDCDRELRADAALAALETAGRG